MTFIGGVVQFRVAGRLIAFMILAFTSTYLRATVKVFRINPQQTDPLIAEVHGPHVALYDPQAPSRHRLFLFLVDTRSKATSSFAIDSVFAEWGYHAISLDYEDNVIAISCAYSMESSCFVN
jgi:hypothetical protein